MFLHFLDNPFLSERFSREDFRDLLAGHLDRLQGQNTNGRYDAMIASLQPHRTAYAALLGEQDQALGQRQAKTQTVSTVLTQFKRYVQDELAPDAEHTFTRTQPNPEALAELFPQGRSEYSQASLTEAPVLLKRAAELTKKYQAALGDVHATRSAALAAAFEQARATQGQSKGAVQDDSAEERQLRQAAARQLKLNLLEQLRMHIDDQDRVLALYPAEFFTQPGREDTDADAGGVG